MLSSREASVLLDKLCVQLGLCLTPDAKRDLVENSPVDAQTFADAVLVAEGLDPSTVDRRLYRQVKGVVADAFRASAIDLGSDADAACPFRAGDDVVYAPSDRGRGLNLHTDYARLVPHQTYRVARIEAGAYVVLEGFESAVEGGVFWTEFSRWAG